MKHRFDLAVIGSGPGGFRAAIQAAKVGKKVVVVDKSRPGGGSAHFGTIPSKSLREAALTGIGAKFPAAMQRMRKVIAAESQVVTHQLERNGVVFFQATAAFTSAHEISLTGKSCPARLQADAFVVATGARPVQRPEFPRRLGGVYDSDTILGIKRLPKRLLVVGAGVIGCEYASIFAQLGSAVTLVDRRNELLRAVDHEVVAALQQEFLDRGVTIQLSAELGELKKISAGSSQLALRIGKKNWRGEAVFVCLGRQPNTEGLGLEALGVELDPRGQIKVSSVDYRTSQSHIFAVGDVIGPPGLAASSAEQGSIAVSHWLGLACQPFPAAFPAGIYTIPEISSYGLQETEIREKNLPYVIGRAPFRELARGLISGERTGFIKLLVHRETRQLLGVHCFGVGASELIHIGQVAHALQAPIEFLVQNVFNYPTFAEAYKVAALNALNHLRNGTVE